MEKTIFSPQLETFVPFAGTIDSSRTNMSAKQLTQCVISKNTDYPLIIDKEFYKLSGINSPFMEKAEEDAVVIYNKNNLLVLYYLESKRLVSKYIHPAKKLVNNSLSLKYIIPESQKKVKKGEVLFDYTNMDVSNFMPKIGYRANILYTQFFGYNSDDAMIVSESFAKKAEIEYYEKVYIPITKHWKMFKRDDNDCYLPHEGDELPEILVRYLPIDSSDHFLADISNMKEIDTMFFMKKIKGLASDIKNGKIAKVKVHKNTPKSFEELKQDYLFNDGLIEEVQEMFEKNKEVLNELENIYKNIMPENKAIDLAEQTYHQYIQMNDMPKHFQEKVYELYKIESSKVDFLLEIDILLQSKTTRGDKFTNLFAGKGTAALIIPDKLMPKNPDGKPYDVIFNTLGIPGRNNWAVIFEALLSKMITDIEKTAKSKDYNSLYEKIKFIADEFVKKYDEDYYNDIINILSHFKTSEETKQNLTNDIISKGFYLFVPNFPDIKYKEMNDILHKYSEKFNVYIGKDKVKFTSELMEYLREVWNFKGPFNDTKERTLNIMSGYNYMLKLYHTSFSKYNAVDQVKSYSLSSGQLSRGRKIGGGQHISWQTLNALLAHKENNPVLKEMYTLKSDSLDEKDLFLMKYLKEGKYNLKHKYNSKTKKVLNNALKLIGMRFDNNDDNDIFTLKNIKEAAKNDKKL